MYSDVMLNAKQIDLLKPVGVTKGTVSITDMGTATYSITIGIPPGVQTMYNPHCLLITILSQEMAY